MFLDHWSRKPDLNRAYGAYAYTRFPLILTHMAVLNPDGSYWADTDVPILSSNLTRLSNSRQLIGTIKEYLDSRECDTPPRGKTVELPPELRGGFYRVDFTLPVDRTTEIPVLGFEAFKTKFARPKPKDEEWTVSNRSAGGYVGVDLSIRFGPTTTRPSGVDCLSTEPAAFDARSGPRLSNSRRVMGRCGHCARRSKGRSTLCRHELAPPADGDPASTPSCCRSRAKETRSNR